VVFCIMAYVALYRCEEDSEKQNANHIPFDRENPSDFGWTPMNL